MRNDSQKYEFADLSREERMEYLNIYAQALKDTYQQVGHPGDEVVSSDEIRAWVGRLKEPPLPRAGQTILISDWRMKLDASLEGYEQGYHLSDYADRGWEAVQVPHLTDFLPVPETAGMMKIGRYGIWYRTHVDVPDAFRQGKAFLEFDCLSTQANVYLNGKKVADHYGCYPFRVEVTGHLGPKNQISLEIVHYPANAAPVLYEGYQFAYFDACAGVSGSYGGIGGGVRLVFTSNSYLEDLYIYTAAISDGRAEIRLQAEVRNEGPADFAGEVKVSLRKWYPTEQPAEECLVVPLRLAGRETKKIEEVLLLREFDRWSLDDPNLYLAEVVLHDAVRNVEIDRVTQCLGLRTVENRGGDIYLNGERVFLAGTNLLMGYATDNLVCPRDESMVEDLLCLKKAGANVMRVHAATAYSRLAQVADQMGMMLLWGFFVSWAPLETHIETAKFRLDLSLGEFTRSNLPAMIKHLRAHPSIVTWELGNELWPEKRDSWNSLRGELGDPDSKEYNHLKRAYEVARSHDRTRFIVPESFWGQIWQVVALYANEHGISPEQAREEVFKKVSLYLAEEVYWDDHPYIAPHSKSWFSEHYAPWQWLGGEKPFLLTEFGAGSMPNWEGYEDEPWYHVVLRGGVGPRAEDSIFTHFTREDLEGFRLDEWELSQAFHALTLRTLGEHLREHIYDMDGLVIHTLADAGAHRLGILDNYRRLKLPYLVARALFQPVLVTAMDGFVLEPTETLRIRVSNLGPPIVNASLRLRLTDSHKVLVREEVVKNIDIPGQAVAQIASYVPGRLAEGFYLLEYRLCDGSGVEIARNVDVYLVRK